MVLNENVDRKIIPVAGGKGGVGKSILSANLALSLALFGKRTVLVDLDLGGSNLHTLLGMRNSNPGVGNVLSGRKTALSDLLQPTEWENLAFLPGDVLVYGIGEITKAAKNKIISGLLEIDADYIIIDLGAGANFTVVDFFLISNSGLVVTTPQATSIMNTYAFLKNYVFRFLQRAFAGNTSVSSYLKKQLKERDPGSQVPVRVMLRDIRALDETAGDKAEAFLDVLQPKLVINKVSGPDDVALAEGLRDLTHRNLGLSLECLGTVMTSGAIDGSVNLQRPFILDHPDEVITEEIHRMSQKIIQSRHYPEMPLELDYYEDSFELAQIEAENDRSMAKEDDADNIGHSNVDVEQLMSLISIQQKKIQELQGTVRMLTMERP